MIITVTLQAGLLQPEQLPDLIAAMPSAGGTEGIILSGRLPVWAFATLVHHFHPRPWVATYEPRLGLGVVVASHTPAVVVGQTVPTDGHETLEVLF